VERESQDVSLRSRIKTSNTNLKKKCKEFIKELTSEIKSKSSGCPKGQNNKQNECKRKEGKLIT